MDFVLVKYLWAAGCFGLFLFMGYLCGNSDDAQKFRTRIGAFIILVGGFALVTAIGASEPKDGVPGAPFTRTFLMVAIPGVLGFLIGTIQHRSRWR
jgi:hypothetical protein